VPEAYPGGDRQFFDLKRYCLERHPSGSSPYDALADDTLTSRSSISHRRAVKAGDRDCGRNMSAIVLVA
jgi:hypothetical protein